MQPSERGRKRERQDRNRGTGSSEEELLIYLAYLDFLDVESNRDLVA